MQGPTCIFWANLTLFSLEDDYEGVELASVKPKTLLRLLKGSDAEEAVPLLLAARDAHLAAAAEVELAQGDTVILHCHLAFIDCHCLGIHTVILLQLL